jgi:hypothetical protein
MTSTKNTKDPIADVFASLDAMAEREDQATPQGLGDPQGKELVAKIHQRKAAQLAREALAGITSGRPRRELHRPKYGEQTQVAVPVNSQGRLDVTAELVAGRSRRYAQDLEGWCRAALADHAGRGVLVVWDGMAYTITLDPLVQPRTVTEVHRRDLAAWRTRGPGSGNVVQR